MNAEVLAIGDEITSGQLLDTNSQWLSQRLQELGIRIHYHTTVGDELEPSAAVFRQAIARADVVVATGGLGPTADDLTREALALAAGRLLVLVPEALEHVRSLFARWKREMPKSNEVQAMFPAGSRVVPNPHGTAPGIDLDVPRAGGSGCRVFALPGVPAEMREMWDGYVAGALRGMGAALRVLRRRNLRCFGAGESRIESMLPDLIRRGRSPTVGINASQATIILRIAAEGASEEECETLIESTAATIRASLGTLVYSEGNEELEDVLVRLLRGCHRTLATAEIGTAGLVAQRLGRASGTGGPYLGGLVARGETPLGTLLGLDADLVARHAPADAAIATAMAAACRERFHADYGLAVGGFPETPPDASDPPPVHFAMVSPGGGACSFKIPFAAHPDLLPIYCAKHAINMARLALLRESG